MGKNFSERAFRCGDEAKLKLASVIDCHGATALVWRCRTPKHENRGEISWIVIVTGCAHLPEREHRAILLDIHPFKR
jgi:hypothetical protein